MSSANTPRGQIAGSAAELRALGLAALQGARIQQALILFEQSLCVEPLQPEVQLMVGAILLELRRPAEALASLDEALRLQPRFPEAYYNRGNAQLALGLTEAALHSYDLAISQDAGLPVAFNNRGTALYRLRRFDEALNSYQSALRLRPGYASALNNCGNLLRDMERLPQSLAYLDEALKLQPRYPGALSNKGQSLMGMKQFAEAAACFEAVTRLDPEFRAALGYLFYCRALACDWRAHADLVERLLAAVQNNRCASLAFAFLLASDSAVAQLQCARACSAEEPGVGNAARPNPQARERIRVGYLSTDLREHALAYLMTGVFEQHDRERFEVFALSLRAPDSSRYGERIAAASQFVDLSELSDAQAASRIRALGIDILVDLVGHTQGSRLNILAQRPAPVQVNYLGYPGTLGASYVDYLIADEYLIPEALRDHYSEQIVYLPECFQANDDRRPCGEPIPTREDLGLPPRGLVLGCFNGSFKITPTFFDIWMRLLQAVPESVLWLVGESALTQENLRREAQRRGADPRRLIFAPRIPYAQHLARLGHVDLFLDTLPFNGGTTVSDALWCGVPVVTCSGEAMASRMAGSLLRTAGLPQLIGRDLAHYELLAGELLAQPARLAALRAQLREERNRCPLFNTRRFTRHLELAYTLMHCAHQEGRAPRHLRVPALPAGP